jgi:DNA topoisomerase-3
MAERESGSIAVLAEKPSVARDVAHELGATGRGDGYFHGRGYVVTWALGHLVALAQPHEINPEWRHWRRDLLPILPDRESSTRRGFHGSCAPRTRAARAS